MPNAWAVCVANALICGAYGMMWGGARSFEGRRVPSRSSSAGAAIWIVAFQFEGFAHSVPARISLVSAIIGGLRALCAPASFGTRATAI